MFYLLLIFDLSVRVGFLSALIAAITEDME